MAGPPAREGRERGQAAMRARAAAPARARGAVRDRAVRERPDPEAAAAAHPDRVVLRVAAGWRGRAETPAAPEVEELREAMVAMQEQAAAPDVAVRRDRAEGREQRVRRMAAAVPAFRTAAFHPR